MSRAQRIAGVISPWSENSRAAIPFAWLLGRNRLGRRFYAAKAKGSQFGKLYQCFDPGIADRRLIERQRPQVTQRRELHQVVVVDRGPIQTEPIEVREPADLIDVARSQLHTVEAQPDNSTVCVAFDCAGAFLVSVGHAVASTRTKNASSEASFAAGRIAHKQTNQAAIAVLRGIDEVPAIIGIGAQ